MNETCTVQEKTSEPSRPTMVAGTQAGGTPSTQQQEDGSLSRADIAQKVLKLTGSVRLAARSAHGSAQHWRHCGINE